MVYWNKSVKALFTQSQKLMEMQTHKRFKRTLLIRKKKRQFANFQGNPLCQATKQHLKTQLDDEKWDEKLNH